MSTFTRSKKKELEELEELRKFKEGDKVIVKNGKTGTVKFTGETQFARGKWVGIELDDADGNNDGTVNGINYFHAESDHGIFLPPHKVSHLETEEIKDVYRTKWNTTATATGNAVAGDLSCSTSPDGDDHAACEGSHALADQSSPIDGNSATGNSGTTEEDQERNSLPKGNDESITTGTSSECRQRRSVKSVTAHEASNIEAYGTSGTAEADRSSLDKPSTGRTSLEKRTSRLEEIKRRKELSRQKVTSMLPGTSSDSKRSSNGSKDKIAGVRGGRSSLPVPRRITQQSRSIEDRKSIDNAELSAVRNTPRNQHSVSYSKGVFEVGEPVPEDISESDDEELQFAHETDDRSATLKESGEMMINKEILKEMHALLAEKLQDAEGKQTVALEESETAKLRKAFKGILDDNSGPPCSPGNSCRRRDASDAALRSPPKKQLEERAQMQASISALKRQVSELTKQVEDGTDRVRTLENDKEELSVDKDIVEEEKLEQEWQARAWREKCEKLEEELRTLRETQVEPKSQKNSNSKQEILQQNWQLREGLSKLRYIYKVEVDQLRRELSSSQKEAARSTTLADEAEKQTKEIRSLRAENFELLEQLDTANAYEEMIEDLTEKNLALSDRLEELKVSINDFEELHCVYENLEQYYAENERLLKMEISKQQEVIDEYHRRVEQLVSAIHLSRKHNEKLRKAPGTLLEGSNTTQMRHPNKDSRYNAVVVQLRKALERQRWMDTTASEQFKNLKYSQTGIRLLQVAAYTFGMMIPAKVMSRFWNVSQHSYSPVSKCEEDTSSDATCAMFVSFVCSIEQVLGGADLIVSRCYEFLGSVVQANDPFSEASANRVDPDAVDSSLQRYQRLPILIEFSMTLVRVASLFRLLRAALLTGQGSLTRLLHTVPKCVEQMEECEQLVQQLVEKKIETLGSCSREVQSLFAAACDMQEAFSSQMDSEAHSVLAAGIVNLSPSNCKMVEVSTCIDSERKRYGREIVTMCTALQLRFLQHVDLLIKGYMCYYRVVASMSPSEEQLQDGSKQDNGNERFQTLKGVLRTSLSDICNATASICTEARRLADSCHKFGTESLREQSRFWALRHTVTPTLLGPLAEALFPGNMFEVVQEAQNSLWQYHLGRCVTASKDTKGPTVTGYWCCHVGENHNELGTSGFSASDVNLLRYVFDGQSTQTNSKCDYECVSLSALFAPSASEDDLVRTRQTLEKIQFRCSSIKRISVECVSALSLETSNRTVDIRQQELVPFLKPFLDVKSRLESSSETVEDLESARSLHAETIQELEEKEQRLREAENRIKVMERRVNESIGQDHAKAREEEKTRQLRNELDRQRMEYENKLEMLESLREDSKQTAYTGDHIHDSHHQQPSARLSLFRELRLLIERQKEQIGWWKSMHVSSKLRSVPCLPEVLVLRPRKNAQADRHMVSVTALETLKKITGTSRSLRANVKLSTVKTDWRVLESCAVSCQQQVKRLGKQSSSALKPAKVGATERHDCTPASLSAHLRQRRKNTPADQVYQELLVI
eukprot:gb/GECG01001041.1/.p1 GENE.gb/GECG01001041.1/~~gb/GECG01001041.1/.p1  ORF type:complete len:1521 (+),score=250.80 gb/GECG01001041.1/:1-4563(+)